MRNLIHRTKIHRCKKTLFWSLIFFILPLMISTSCSSSKEAETIAEKPNIIIFYVDDMGYADVGIYGAKGVSTPNIDNLAKEGVMFTDAHSPAATCTPSRYSLLTGNYAFRNNAAILPGDAPLLIDTAQLTLPKMLKNAGYRTAVVGKWHLGLGYGEVDWNNDVAPGPNEVGFDYSFIIPATGDRVPTVFLENHNVVDLDKNDPIEVSYAERIGDDPIGLEKPEMLKMKADTQHSETIINGVSRIGYMTGGESARWIDEDFPYIFDERSKRFIGEESDQPFFLFYSFHDIHVPRVPHADFVGKSDMGPRGDAIAQVDWVVGEIMAELRRKGIENNTLVIFTSDNGPVLDDGYMDQAVELIGDHNPSGPYRGGKYSAYEAGTRVPTITYWPGKVASGESAALLTQVDLIASLADLVNEDLNDDVIDSQNHLQAWLGKSDTGRKIMVEEAFTLALRDNQWKYIQPHTGTIPGWMKNKEDIESGLTDHPQLFNLENDPGEQLNLADSLQEKVVEMQSILNNIVAEGKKKDGV